MNTKRNISENQDFSGKDVLFRIEMFLSIVFNGSMVKNPYVNAGDAGLIPGLGRFPGAGNVNPPTPLLLLGNPWTGEPGRQESMASQRVRHNSAHIHT